VRCGVCMGCGGGAAGSNQFSRWCGKVRVAMLLLQGSVSEVEMVGQERRPGWEEVVLQGGKWRWQLGPGCQAEFGKGGCSDSEAGSAAMLGGEGCRCGGTAGRLAKLWTGKEPLGWQV